MNIRNGRLRTFAVLGTLTTLAFSSVQAGQVGGSEDKLIGISLRTSTFRDVLKKYGQPDEVQGGGPFLPTPPKDAPAAGAAPGSGGGRGMAGPPGVPGGGSPSSGGGMAGGTSGKRFPSKNGFPGKNDGGPAAGAPSAPGSGGYPGSGGPAGMPGGSPSSGGYPGSGGGPGSGGRGLPGFPGNSESGGAPGSAGLPGSGEGGEAAPERPVTEATWWYHNNRKGYHMSFLFDKHGRVIQIQEYGVASLHSGKTRQGITLGSNMTQVLSRYGWSNDGAHDGENVVMRYGGSDKVAFQMVKNKVLGITVAVGR